MRAIVSFFGLFVGLCMCVSGAWALTCAISYKIPSLEKPSVQKIDAQWRQQIDTQLREGFDAQTRRQFGAAEIVAEAKVVGLGEVLRSGWSSSQLVEVIVTRYLRAPLTKQARDRYHITAAPGALKVNDTVLFFARVEAKETWQARLVPPNPKRVQPFSEIPSHWTQRVWNAQGSCTNPVYQLTAPENAYLVQFLRQLAEDKLAPSSLRLSFSTRAPVVKTWAEIPVTVTEMAGAKASRTVRIRASGTDLDLHAGRYRLLWPELPGYQAACSAEHEKQNCEIDLVAGGNARMHVEYRPTAQVSLVPLTLSGKAIKLLGELEWQRIDLPKMDVANERQIAIQDTDVRESELDQWDDHGHPIVPGRYKLQWVVKSYAPALTSYDACELLGTQKIALRWRMGAGALATQHDLPIGHSVVVAEVPESQIVNLEFTHAQQYLDVVDVRPRCATDIAVRISGNTPLKVAAFRGQQYELEHGCNAGKEGTVSVRTLMQADQNLVLDLK